MSPGARVATVRPSDALPAGWRPRRCLKSHDHDPPGGEVSPGLAFGFSTDPECGTRRGLVLRMLADAETARVASAPARIAVPGDALGHSPASRQRNQKPLVGNQRSPAKRQQRPSEGIRGSPRRHRRACSPSPLRRRPPRRVAAREGCPSTGAAIRAEQRSSRRAARKPVTPP